MVLTMTPRRAQLVADSIELGDADHTLWLDSLADLLRSAADRDHQPVDAATATSAISDDRGIAGRRHSLRRWRSPLRRS